MNKKELKKQEHISMEKFLKNYVGIENEKVLNWLTELTHREIKEICDDIYSLDLTRISFESVTKEELERGEVILVLDKENNPAPYTNPTQNEFEDIIREETEKHFQEIYTSENHLQTFDDYIDDIDEIALDQNIPSQKIKTLSKQKYKQDE